MSRQLDQEQEERTAKRSAALANALDYGIVGALDALGIELMGFSIKHDAWSCLLTIRADIGGKRHIAHVGSDSIANCFLRALSDARRDALKWEACKYHRSGV